MRKVHFEFRGVKRTFTQPLKVGDVVFLISERYINSRNNPIIGNIYECDGKIVGFDEIEDTCLVDWSNGASSTYKNKELVLVNEFLEHFKPYVDADGFKENDIVYIKYSINKTPAPEWPMITTPHEIDCKVLRVINTPLQFKRIYELVSGAGYRVKATEDHVISPTQRDAALVGEAGVYVATDDGAPLYNKGDKFRKIGDYIISDDNSVSISISKINKNFELCSISDK